MKKLIGCIDTLTFKTIKTRWFYFDAETNIVKDITSELCHAIKKFNERAEKSRDNETDYVFKIPYVYIHGLSKYSFGSGLSNYLQNEHLYDLAKLGKFDFDISDCIISMFTKADLRNHGIKTVWQEDIADRIRSFA